jgi:adenylate cyclase class 2
MSDSPVEIEVKFLLADVPALRRRLTRLGAQGLGGQVFETNYRYDDVAGNLVARHCLLRLRKDDAARLTFKRPRAEGRRQFKVHEELEVTVSDFDTTHAILAALGYRRVQVYEKRRETFALEGALICLDRLPFGDFIEIEGAPDRIRAAARALGFNWDRRILANYLQLFDALRRARGFPFGDATFANFAQAAGDMRPILQTFEAGARAEA